jgi:glucosamine-phosphate N-acetyltransferase
LEIRRLKPTDFAKGFPGVLKGLTRVTGDPDKAYAIYRERSRQGCVTFVAVENDRVIGAASVLVEQKYCGKPALHIEDVAVLRRHRDKGVGKLLVEACLRLARERGAYRATLFCSPDVQEFYEKCGFWVNGVSMRVKP